MTKSGDTIMAMKRKKAAKKTTKKSKKKKGAGRPRHGDFHGPHKK